MSELYQNPSSLLEILPVKEGDRKEGDNMMNTALARETETDRTRDFEIEILRKNNSVKRREWESKKIVIEKVRKEGMIK